MELFTRTWGNPNLPPLVCVHGLTRNSLDFEPLAQRLSATYYVLAPDMPGRGQTPPLADSNQYTNPYYAQLLLQWLAARGIAQCAWLGTSMGGMIGMIIAATAPSVITKLILNDVGAIIPKVAIQRLKTYVGKDMEFASMEAAKARLRQIYTPFGLRSEAEWEQMFKVSLNVLADGSCSLAYDPRIAEPLQQLPDKDINLWPLVSAIKCPTLLIRGAESDLLTRTTAWLMARKRNIELVEIAGCGHAPALYSDDQIAIVERFLSGEAVASHNIIKQLLKYFKR